ncbi:TLR adapter interacting with SLC15A4 on the lysosome-like [Tiliqua scincoides]|uniref:TLR adapter interacting with SLC15A4 on the lysosome-like n=1 Tax=Tiliqua scincoides TaxID=71010 RepID=UPI0034630DB4
MLAECVLTGIAYRDETYKSHHRQRLKTVSDDSWQDELTAADANRDFHPKAERQGAEMVTVASCEDQEVHQGRPAQKSLTNGCIGISPSSPLCTPKRKQYCEKLDLYRSWSGQSLYQNYPDLHIGGGHIADHTCDSGCVMGEVYAEWFNGPVLLSEDFPSSQASPLNHLQKAKAIKPWNGDETGEKSMTTHREPLSNSMINIYMEVKVQELYKQLLEEEMTRCGSLTHVLTSSLLMGNVGEPSLQLPHDSYMEASKATQALWHSLARLSFQNASYGSSDDFSTPNLQISKPLLERKSSVARNA